MFKYYSYPFILLRVHCTLHIVGLHCITYIVHDEEMKFINNYSNTYEEYKSPFIKY